METEQSPSTDVFNSEAELIRASHGQRLANYLIDLATFYALMFLIGMLIGILFPQYIEKIEQSAKNMALVDRLLSLLLYAVYMSSIEALFKGKSLGKLITRTRALNLDGSRITTATAFARGLARAVPFCVFSALTTPCNPWQDRWTRTMVVDERVSVTRL